MQWLTPLTAVYAGAVAIPLLVLLYFLKLRRTEQLISSTLLWKRAVQDLQVNAPFQRLRRNILFLLQLLAILAIVLGLGKPVLSLRGGPGKRYVVLIDRSASMTTADGPSGRTRLEQAKEQAKTFVRSLRGGEFLPLGGGDQVMVIAFDDHAKVMCNFTSDKRQVLAAIDSIKPGHNRSLLAEAVTVARAFTQSPGEEANNRSSQPQAQLVLFSDGRLQDADRVAAAGGEVQFHCTGRSSNNLGITAMRARRSYEDPSEVSVFATVANYGRQPVNADIQLSLNGDVRAVRSASVPGRVESDNEPNRPGTVGVTFTLRNAEAGVLEIRQLSEDALGCDDAAWAILPPPKRLSVLLVSKGNIVLESALRSCPLAKLDVVGPEQFRQMDRGVIEVDQPYDIIVLDDVEPMPLPRCRYLVFGRPPADIGVSSGGIVKNQVLVDWRANHAVLKYVNLGNLFAARSCVLELPRDAEVLAEFNDTPAVAVLRRAGSALVLVSFNVLESNWPFEPSFVVFCYNALGYLSTEFGLTQQNNLKVGAPIVAEGFAAGATGSFEGPGMEALEVRADDSGTIRLAETEQVGIYSLTVAGREPMLYAVNLLDSAESDISPRRVLNLSGEEIASKQPAVLRANIPFWPFLVLAALGLAFVEWVVYNSKVRI